MQSLFFLAGYVWIPHTLTPLENSDLISRNTQQRPRRLWHIPINESDQVENVPVKFAVNDIMYSLHQVLRLFTASGHINDV